MRMVGVCLVGWLLNVGLLAGCGSKGAKTGVADDAEGGIEDGADGGIVTLASNQAEPSELAVANGTIYWLNSGDSTIRSVPVTGGTPAVVDVGTDGISPVGIAVDSSNLYWLNDDGTVWKLPLSGGTATKLASGLMPVVSDSIVTNGTNIYWDVDEDSGLYGTSVDGSTVRSPLNNACGLDSLTADTVDASNFYFASDSANGFIGQAPLAGDTAACWTMLATGVTNVYSMAVDSSNVYIINGDNDGAVDKVPIGGGAMAPLAIDQGVVAGVAVAEGSVYWTSMSNGTVMKVPATGGMPGTVAAGQDSPQPIAVDSTSVYWAAGTTGSMSGLIMKAPL